MVMHHIGGADGDGPMITGLGVDIRGAKTEKSKGSKISGKGKAKGSGGSSSSKSSDSRSPSEKWTDNYLGHSKSR